MAPGSRELELPWLGPELVQDARESLPSSAALSCDIPVSCETSPRSGFYCEEPGSYLCFRILGLYCSLFTNCLEWVSFGLILKRCE